MTTTKEPKYCPNCGKGMYLYRTTPDSTHCLDCGEYFTILEPDEFERLEEVEAERMQFGDTPGSREQVLKRAAWLEENREDLVSCLQDFLSQEPEPAERAKYHAATLIKELEELP